MKKFFEKLMLAVFGIIAVFMGLVAVFNVSVGMLEIAYWIITGDWFHFTSAESVSVF